ncbi:MAG: hypothetical protein GY839_06255 [candidate division Zixibacteria bacterium]|nr:hypothetical protein [candidate division Zixibacteria bacterium]
MTIGIIPKKLHKDFMTFPKKLHYFPICTFLISFAITLGIYIYKLANAEAVKQAQGQVASKPIETIGFLAILTSIYFLFMFLWVFTGRSYYPIYKIQWAFILSYCVIFMFLAIPMLAPYAITIYPEKYETMTKSPVGIVISKTYRDNDTTKAEKQWVLNIGGYVSKIKPEVNSTITDTLAASSSNPVKTNKDDIIFEPVQIKGGIVIPLYVIILSILGGAINMTRRVPEIHQEAEKVRNAYDKAQAEHDEEHKDKILQIQKIMGGIEASIDSSETSTAEKEWRRLLIDQYMYLFSAAFLGIATYYLLHWMNFLETPAIVIVSFSIGLISEYVLLKITSIAKSIVGAQVDEKTEKLITEKIEEKVKELSKQLPAAPPPPVVPPPSPDEPSA